MRGDAEGNPGLSGIQVCSTFLCGWESKLTVDVNRTEGVFVIDQRTSMLKRNAQERNVG